MKPTNERKKIHSTDCESVNDSILDSANHTKKDESLSFLKRKEQSLKTSLFFGEEEKKPNFNVLIKKNNFGVENLQKNILFFKDGNLKKNGIFQEKLYFENTLENKNIEILNIFKIDRDKEMENLIVNFENWFKNCIHKNTPEIFLKNKKIKKEKEEVSILTKIIDKSLKVDLIKNSDLNLLSDLEINILKLFIQKKFNSKNVIEIIDNDILIPKIKKSKRNEEILKFSLKGFFKKCCMEKKKDINCKKNFFELKKELCLFIFKEISQSLNLKLEDFLKLSFVDEKKLMIKGNKKILLYNNSPFFKNNISNYLKNHLIFDYTKKRKDKIQTIIFNIYIKFVNGRNYDLKGIEKFFLNNPKLKLPWSNQELDRAKNYCCKNFSC